MTRRGKRTSREQERCRDPAKKRRTRSRSEERDRYRRSDRRVRHRSRPRSVSSSSRMSDEEQMSESFLKTELQKKTKRKTVDSHRVMVVDTVTGFLTANS